MIRHPPLRAVGARLHSFHHASTPIPIRTRLVHTSPCCSKDIWAKYRRPPLKQPDGPSSSLLKKIEPTFAPPAITGPRDKAVEVEGVKIPPKPIPPGDEDCCMSGCVHCVLTIYAEDSEEYQNAMDDARKRLEAKGVPREKWPPVMDELKQKGTEKKEPAVDPTMAAFMALENKLKKK